MNQWLELVDLWKSTGNYITKTFPHVFNTLNPTGFQQAINALHRNQFEKIIPACDDEITENGQFTNECRLLRSLIVCSVDKSTENIKKCLYDLNAILQTKMENDELIFATKLCNSKLYFALGNPKLGNIKYDKLIHEYNTPEKKVVIHFWIGFDNCSIYDKKHLQKGLNSLKDACDIMAGNFFPAKYYTVIFELAANDTDIDATSQYCNELVKLNLDYPDKHQPLPLLISYYIQKKQFNMAVMYFQKLACQRENYESLHKMEHNTVQTDLELIIAYLKRIIEDDPTEFSAYINLTDIYCFDTHEYRKCLEVLDKAMDEINDPRLYGKLYERRHLLLMNINNSDFWAEL